MESSRKIRIGQLDTSTGLLTGSGITNRFAKFTTSTTLTGSTSLTELPSGFIGVGTTNPLSLLHVSGSILSNSFVKSGGTSNQFLMADGSVSFGPSGSVGGTGTTNYIPKWSSTTAQTNSTIFDNGNVGIGTTNPLTNLQITGFDNARARTVSINSAFNASWESYDGTNLVASGLLAGSGGAQGAWSVYNTGVKLTVLSNGFVGIDTITPEYKLDVVNGDISLYRTQKLQFSGPTAGDRNRAYIGGNPNNDLIFGIGAGTEAVRITNGGRFLINSTIPNGIDYLEVNGSAISTAWRTSGGTSAQYVKGDGSLGAISGLTGSTSSGGVGGTGTPNYISKWSGTTGLTNSTIFDNGTNVGIGTTTPNTIFHILSNLGGNSELKIQNGSTFASGINLVGNDDVGASYNYIVSNTNAGTEHWKIGGAGIGGTLPFITIGIERMRISYGGNVLIGTTTDNLVDKLQVNGSGYFSTAVKSFDFRTAAAGFITYDADNLGTGTLSIRAGGLGGASVAFFTSNGRLGIGNTNPLSKLNVTNSYYAGTPTKGNSAAYFDNQGIGVYMGGNEYTYGYIQSEQTDIVAPKSLSLNPNGGNVLIGTTTDNGVDKLQVNGSIRSTSLMSNTFNFLSDNNKTAPASIGKFSTFTQGPNDFELIFNRSAAGTDGYYGIQSVEQTIGYRNLALQQNGGNLGIGITNPNYKTVISIAGISGQVDYNLLLGKTNVADANGSAIGLLFSVEGSGPNFGKGAIAFERTESYARGSFHFLLRDSADGSNPTLADTKMTITKNGRIGIGLTNPYSVLHSRAGVQSMTVSPANAAGFFTGGDVGAMFGQFDAAGAYGTWMQSARESDNSPFSLSLNPNGGNVGVGTTNPGIGKLQIEAIAGNETFIALNSKNVGGGCGNILFTENGTSKWNFGSLADNSLIFNNQGVGASLILSKSSNNILINTTNDNFIDKLQVNGSISANYSLKLPGNEKLAFIIGQPDPNFGPARKFVKIISNSSSVFISGKITIGSDWHYADAMGILALETGVYIGAGSPQIDAGSSRIVSETSSAAVNLRISDITVVGGFVGFYIYSVNTNPAYVQFDGKVSGPAIWDYSTPWESFAFPARRGIEVQGDLTVAGNINGTISKTIPAGTSSNLLYATIGDNDYARIMAGSFATNSGYLEIATADDATEPIFVRQYLGAFGTVIRTLTLLDEGGNSIFPGNITINGSNTGLIFDNPASGSSGLTFRTSGVNIWSINKGAGNGTEDWNFYNFGRGKIDFSIKNSTGNIVLGTDTDLGKFTILAYDNGGINIFDPRTATSGEFYSGIVFRDYTGAISANIKLFHNEYFSATARRLSLGVSNLNTLNITNNSHVLINTTTDNGVDKLQVAGNISTIGGVANGTLGYIQSWGGSTGYPTLFSNISDRWIMHINPHISYVQNGVNGYTGTMNGATIRMASDTAASVSWDIGIGTNSIGTDRFSIGRNATNFLDISNDGGGHFRNYLDIIGNTYAYGGISVGTASVRTGALANSNSIAIGDTDTGFRQNGDGILEVYTNDILSARYQSGGIELQGYTYLNNAGRTQGTIQMFSNDGGGGYNTRAIELREVGLSTTSNASDPNFAPAIGFHWGGINQTTLLMDSVGNLAVRQSPSTWGYKLLHEGNYNNYSPSLGGAGASGTWGINVTGTARKINIGTSSSIGDLNIFPTDSASVMFDTYDNNAINKPVSVNNANGVISFTINHGPQYGKQIAFADNDDLYIRRLTANLYQPWHALLHSGNYWNYAIPQNNRTNWNLNGVIGNVVGQLAWKNYGNNHTIFDASQGTSPDGGGIDNANPNQGWTPSYPTLMGWNGTYTYGVRVDSARSSDSVGGYLQSDLAKQGYSNSGNWDTFGAVDTYSSIIMRVETGAINPPAGNVYNWSLYQQGNTGRGSQVAVSAYGAQRMFFRGANGDTGSYGGWNELLHTNNYYSYTIQNQIGYAQSANIWISGRMLIGSSTDNLTDRLQVEGTIKATGSITAGSDERIKTNIRPLENSLNKVMNVTGFKFDRIDSGDKNQIGFIAQNLEKEFPELVHTDNTEEAMKSVNYQAMTAVLVECIKELKNEINQLKEEITILKNNK